MISVSSAVLCQGKIVPVTVEVAFARGLPAWNATGLFETPARALKKRVQKAFEKADMEFPLRHIAVNVKGSCAGADESPADLAVAVALALASSPRNGGRQGNIFAAGEIDPNGELVRETSMREIIHLAPTDCRFVIVPFADGGDGLGDISGIPVRIIQKIEEVVPLVAEESQT